MEAPAATPTTNGLAFRVSILGSEMAEAFQNVHAQIDSGNGLVHIFSVDGQTHYLSIPLNRALIEWKDPSPLDPQLRMPSLGANAFGQAGEQLQRMMEGFGKGFGPR